MDSIRGMNVWKLRIEGEKTGERKGLSNLLILVWNFGLMLDVVLSRNG